HVEVARPRLVGAHRRRAHQVDAHELGPQPLGQAAGELGEVGLDCRPGHRGRAQPRAGRPRAGATSSAGWATRTAEPISRSPAWIWIAQPGLATATTGAPAVAIASAFWRRSRDDSSGWRTL